MRRAALILAALLGAQAFVIPHYRFVVSSQYVNISYLSLYFIYHYHYNYRFLYLHPLAVNRRRDETIARHYVRLRRDGGQDEASPKHQVQ